MLTSSKSVLHFSFEYMQRLANHMVKSEVFLFATFMCVAI